MTTVIITDGSADNISGQGGWCAIVRTGRSVKELVGHEPQTTSNRMELTAAIEGLRSLSVPTDVTLVADSSYLLNTLKNKWYEQWFQEKRGKPRPNMDLWHQLVGLIHFHNVTFVKVKGHSGDYWNTRADKLAAHARVNRITSLNTYDADDAP